MSEIIVGLSDDVLLYNVIMDFLIISNEPSLFQICKKLSLLFEQGNFWLTSYRNYIKLQQEYSPEEEQYLKQLGIHSNMVKSRKLRVCKCLNYSNYWLYSNEWWTNNRDKMDRYLSRLERDLNAITTNHNEFSRKMLRIVSRNVKKRRLSLYVMWKFMQLQVLTLAHFKSNPNMETLDKFFEIWEEILDHVETSPFGFSFQEILQLSFSKKNLTLAHHFGKQLLLYYFPQRGGRYKVDDKYKSTRVSQLFHPFIHDTIRSHFTPDISSTMELKSSLN